MKKEASSKDVWFTSSVPFFHFALQLIVWCFLGVCDNETLTSTTFFPSPSKLCLRFIHTFTYFFQLKEHINWSYHIHYYSTSFQYIVRIKDTITIFVCHQSYRRRPIEFIYMNDPQCIRHWNLSGLFTDVCFWNLLVRAMSRGPSKLQRGANERIIFSRSLAFGGEAGMPSLP